MTPHNKPPEELYAQTAAFDNEHSHPFVKGDHVGQMATALLAGEPFDTRFQFMGREMKQEFSADQYVDFLRSADPETRADIAFLADKMQRYSQFSGSVDHALREASEGSQHYLGSGSNGSAYQFEQDGKAFAVKTGGVGYGDVRIFRLGAQVKEPYRDKVAQLEALDLDTKISVMNRIPGERIQNKTFAERDAIPKRHIKDAIDTVLAMNEAGLTPDPKESNFLYDEDAGFGFIDYMPLGKRDKYTSSGAVMELKHMLTAGLQKTPEQIPHTEKVRIINKFLDVLEEDYPGLLALAAEHQAEINANPSTGSEGIYDIHLLPAGQEFEEFKARVVRLGLEGDLPYATTPSTERPADLPDIGDDLVW